MLSHDRRRSGRLARGFAEGRGELGRPLANVLRTIRGVRTVHISAHAAIRREPDHDADEDGES
jgi:hypothetical protein